MVTTVPGCALHRLMGNHAPLALISATIDAPDPAAAQFCIWLTPSSVLYFCISVFLYFYYVAAPSTVRSDLSHRWRFTHIHPTYRMFDFSGLRRSGMGRVGRLRLTAWRVEGF